MSQHVNNKYDIILKKLQAASLQNYNTELVRSLEGIRERRENLLIDMKKDAESKNEIIQEIEKLNQELEELNSSIAKKEEIKSEYDKVINNTELAYFKLLEGSKVLLAILKRDEANLQKKLGDN